VNSANLGPYGDAITYELVPYLEKKYRAIGAGWARFMYGGSTGGWEAMGAQFFYPDEYNGAWCACPDPIDFRAYTVVDVYIDRDVASYWRDHYDLSYILRRDWSKGLGKKLQGKLHIYVGEADNYYLNDAVYLVEEFLKGTSDPHYDGEVDYEPRAEHCWNGDHTRPNAISRLRYYQMFAPKIVQRILASAPTGGDVTSWRY
jgi:hypothetical protein